MGEENRILIDLQDLLKRCNVFDPSYNIPIRIIKDHIEKIINKYEGHSEIRN